MCSVETNLATSLQFQPIRCGTMLCHFGRTRNGYGATRFILFNSNAESRATSGYVVTPERFGQSGAQASRNVERTKKKPSFVPSNGFNQCSLQYVTTCKHERYSSFSYTSFYIFYLDFGAFLLISSYGKPV